MKIALFTDTYPPEINGVSVSVQLHQKVLQDQGHDVLVVTTNPFRRKIDRDHQIIRIPGIELKKVYGYRLASFFNGKVYRIIKKWQPELIHIHTDAGIGIFGKIITSLLKIPSVVTYHTMYEDYTHYAGLLKGIASRFVKKFSKTIAEQCTEFIAPSVKTKEKIRSYGADRYINVVPTGIDFSRFDRKNLDQEQLTLLKNKWVKPGEKVLLSLGRVAKEKSIDVILESFSFYLNQGGVPTRLLVVGDGPDLPLLKDYTKQLHIDHAVSFVGAAPIKEVPYYYHLADVFVSASLTETQGLTFMEAMAASRLILCRYDENLVGIIRHQETGFIYANPKEFAQQLTKILSLQEAEQLSIQQAMATVIQQFDLNHFYQNLIEVYHRALRQYW